MGACACVRYYTQWLESQKKIVPFLSQDLTVCTTLTLQCLEINTGHKLYCIGIIRALLGLKRKKFA